VNDELLAELALPEPERFVSRSGPVEVQGWIHWPPQREEGAETPVILYTGGGPGGMRAEVFVHEFHLYAAQGYAVINCNARGNYGFGEAFSDAPRGDWGGVDYEDNMAFLRDVLEAHPELDGERLAVAGGSYGGFMASWIAARHPEFSAAVVDRTLFNRYAFSGTSDIGLLLDLVEFDGRYPWEAAERYLEVSPISYVGDVRVPTLVVHSALDHRCPVDQGEQLYMALRVQGVPTELVRFPNETHELSRNGRPQHRLYRLASYLDWFGRWL
jgi:dipeptidyl aminopeptidase/acylaminoacyl peptidase